MENAAIVKEIIVQILGFGVVFFVLKKFAWSSLLGMIDQRQKHISDRLESLEKQKSDLVKLETDYKNKIENIEKEARAKIQEAATLGSQIARDTQDKARAEAQAMLAKAKEEIASEISKARVSLRDDVAMIAADIAKKAVAQKLGDLEHKKLIEQFSQELESIKR